MKHSYVFVFLLLFALIGSAGVSLAQLAPGTTTYLVRLKHRDVENLYNPNYHHIKLKLAQQPDVRTHVFVESQNAFLVQVTPTLKPEQLTQAIDPELVAVAPIASADAEQMLKKQVAYKLSRMKDKAQVSDPTFPTYKPTADGNLSAYQSAIEQWLDSHPEQYRQLFTK